MTNATQVPATAAAAETAAPARKEAAGIVKRTSAFNADPRAIGRREGFNPRINFGEIEELAKSIKANTLLQPLRVKRVAPYVRDDGKGIYGAIPVHFELVDGDRRLTAIELILKKDPNAFPEGVPVILVDKAQDEIKDLIQMFEANTGKPFEPLEEAAAYDKMRKAGMTVKQIGAAVGRKHMHVMSILALIDGDESLKAAAKAGTIGKTMAKDIAVHARGDAAKQAELTKAAVEAGGDKKKLRAVKAQLDQARRGKAAKKGRTLKIRALSDDQLSALGSTLAEKMATLLKEAGKPLDFDMQAWVGKNEDLALAASFGALQALKAAAGVDIKLEF